MQVSISGQHIVIGESIKEYIENRISEVVQKYFENAIRANVHFRKESYQFVCDIKVNEGAAGHSIIVSDGHSEEIYSAFDIALVKLEKQLRRYKSRLKDRHDRVKPSTIALEAVKYVISPTSFDEEEGDGGINPVIIAEKSIEILPLSVSEAVMKMDLENVSALMFENSKSGRINVVYYKRDGNIAWVDSR